jgi:hypothetical protein
MILAVDSAIEASTVPTAAVMDEQRPTNPMKDPLPSGSQKARIH